MLNPKQIIKAKQPPSFAFVDETGITKDPKQPKIGLGLLVIDRQPLVINQVLREIFLCAVHNMKAIEERFEFKFTYVTHRSLPYYRAIIDTLSQYKDHWHFTSIQAKRNHQSVSAHWSRVNTPLIRGVRGVFCQSVEIKPPASPLSEGYTRLSLTGERLHQSFWSQYLLLLTKLLRSADQPLIVIADHLNKPKKSKSGLSSLINNTPKLVNILQIESQGSVLLQVADVLLGATVYMETTGKDQLKREIAQRTTALLSHQDKITSHFSSHPHPPMTFSQSRNTHRNIATSRVSLNQKSHIRARLERKIREVILSWRLRSKTGAGIDPIYATPNIYKDNNK